MGGEALGEVVALEQLRDGDVADQPEQRLHVHVQPLGVVADLQLRVGEQHVAGLVDVRARVGVDLLAGQHRPCRRAATGVPDARRVVADDQHDGVARVLELAQLLEHHGVAEMDVGGRRVEAELDAQRTVLREPPLERSAGQAVDRVAGQMRGRASGVRGGSAIRPNARVAARPQVSAVRGELAAPARPIYGSRPPQPPGRRRRRPADGGPTASRVRHGGRAAEGSGAHPQAARAGAAGGPRAARDRLDGVRDDDGRRLRPARRSRSRPPRTR